MKNQCMMTGASFVVKAALLSVLKENLYKG
jgi:hypothetical protein